MGFCWGPLHTCINNDKNAIKNFFRTFMSVKLLSKLNLTLGFSNHFIKTFSGTKDQLS